MRATRAGEHFIASWTIYSRESLLGSRLENILVSILKITPPLKRIHHYTYTSRE